MPNTNQQKNDNVTCGSCNREIPSQAFAIGVAKDGLVGFEDHRGKFIKYPLGDNEVSACVELRRSNRDVDFWFTVCDPNESPECVEDLRAKLQTAGFDIVREAVDLVTLIEIPIRVTEYCL